MTISQLIKSNWRKLPHNVRDTAILRHGKKIAKRFFQTDETVQSYTGRTDFPSLISTIEDLDQFIEYGSHLEICNQNAFFNLVSKISFEFPESDIESDPYSQAYRHQQQRVYEKLRDHRPYNSKLEALPIYVKETIETPYPYVTRSSEIAGKHLISIGYLLKTINLRSGQKVLEMGAGHGSLTLNLAQLDCHTTVLDISNDFLKVIKGRLDKIGRKANLVCADFLDAKNLNQKFDAIIFHASFHHCSDHQQLIQDLKNILAPGGKVYFCNEPISDNFPMPWGLRMDGESIFHIRFHGWLELGFQKKYFTELMHRNGWQLSEVATPKEVGINIIIARLA